MSPNTVKEIRAKVFILIYGAQNLLPAICAIKLLNLQNQQITLVMRQHSLSDQRFGTQESVVRKFFEKLEVDFVKFSELQWQEFKKSKTKLDKSDVSSETQRIFLYPHDLTSNTSQIIAKNVKSNVNICYGDGYGLLINNVSRVKYNFNPKNQIKFFKLIFRLLQHRIPLSVTPNKFVAILPVSQIQNISLASVDLLIPKKQLVLDEIANFHTSNPELNIFFQNQISMSKTGDKTFVLLLENFSECGFIDEKNELQLYLEIIRENVEIGSCINIKPHPWSNGKLAKEIVRDLYPKYVVRVIDGEVENYPIELWPIDFSEIDLISMSTPALSFNYLFRKKVIQPLTLDKVVKYFKPEYYQALRMQIELTDNPIANLQNWDMESFLYVTNER